VDGGASLSLRVSPGAKRTAIKGMYGEGALRVSVAAPPEKGKANAELEAFLADLVGVGRSEVEVVRGHTGRDKVVLLRGLSEREVRESLAGLAG
jgi:uncharacterized protein (TIGR00251 family)